MFRMRIPFIADFHHRGRMLAAGAYGQKPVHLPLLQLLPLIDGKLDVPAKQKPAGSGPRKRKGSNRLPLRCTNRGQARSIRRACVQAPPPGPSSGLLSGLIRTRWIGFGLALPLYLLNVYVPSCQPSVQAVIASVGHASEPNRSMKPSGFSSAAVLPMSCIARPALPAASRNISMLKRSRAPRPMTKISCSPAWRP